MSNKITRDSAERRQRMPRTSQNDGRGCPGPPSPEKGDGTDPSASVPGFWLYVDIQWSPKGNPLLFYHPRPGPNKSYNDVIRFKQLQHEIFITMNYVGKHIEWLKDKVFAGTDISVNEKQFFIKYCNTTQQQLEFLLKTLENPADMKKLEILI